MVDLKEYLEKNIKDCEKAILNGSCETSKAMKWCFSEILDVVERNELEENCEKSGICPDCKDILEACWCD